MITPAVIKTPANSRQIKKYKYMRSASERVRGQEEEQEEVRRGERRLLITVISLGSVVQNGRQLPPTPQSPLVPAAPRYPRTLALPCPPVRWWPSRLPARPPHLLASNLSIMSPAAPRIHPPRAAPYPLFL